jgi:hypothetical protein
MSFISGPACGDLQIFEKSHALLERFVSGGRHKK